MVVQVVRLRFHHVSIGVGSSSRAKDKLELQRGSLDFHTVLEQRRKKELAIGLSSKHQPAFNMNTQQTES